MYSALLLNALICAILNSCSLIELRLIKQYITPLER